MKNKTTLFSTFLILFICSFALVACPSSEKTKVQKQTEKTVDNVTSGLKEAAEEVADETEDLANEIKDEVDDASN